MFSILLLSLRLWSLYRIRVETVSTFDSFRILVEIVWGFFFLFSIVWLCICHIWTLLCCDMSYVFLFSSGFLITKTYWTSSNFFSVVVKMVMWYVFNFTSVLYYIYWLVPVEWTFQDRAIMVIIHDHHVFLNSFCILLEIFAYMFIRETGL